MKIILPFLLLFFVCICAKGQVKIWSLKACMDTALERNILLNQEQLNLQITNINLLQAKAAMLPNLYLNDTHGLNSGFSLDPYTNQYTTQNISSNNLSLNSSVNIFNGHILLYTVRQNRQLYNASLQDVDKTKNDIVLNVLAGYLQLLMDYEAIDVANAQVEATNVQLGQTQKFVQFGKVTELTLLQIISQLAADKLTVVNAENQLQLDKLILLQLMETPVTADFAIVRVPVLELYVNAPLPPANIYPIAAAFWPPLKGAALRTEAAASGIKIAQTYGLPLLTLNAGLKTGYSSIRSNFQYDTTFQSTTIGYVKGDPTQPVIGNVPTYNSNKQIQSFGDQLKNNFGEFVSLSLSVPIFNRYYAHSAIAIAKINVRSAKLNQQQAANDLRKAIETVSTNQVSAGKKLIAVQEQADVEKRTYTDMEKKYAFGVISATDFLIEKNNYNKVNMLLIQAKYDYMLKVKMVDFYLGKKNY